MPLSEQDLVEMLRSPRETLGTELKQWMDPATDEAKAKIAKGCMALRNNNGGVMIFGFDDSGAPDPAVPGDAKGMFHVDVLQRIVAEFSSEPFAIDVQFGERDGVTYPIITVPPGVRTPVAAKRTLALLGAKGPVIKDHAVYVRSISGNNTVSSCEARRGDWDRLVQVCFDNREADIGSFVRRHLSATNMETVGKILTELNSPPPPIPSELAHEFLATGRRRYEAAVKRRGESVLDIGYRETAVVIDGVVPKAVANSNFLQKLFVTQPQHTGWPAWVDSRQFGVNEQPVVIDNAWEALVSDNGFAELQVPRRTFWIIDPKGKLYLLTGFEDDLSRRDSQVGTVGTGICLEFVLQIDRLAEIISVALSFGRTIGCDPTKTNVTFAFRWTRLAGRFLARWADRRSFFRSVGKAQQNEFTTDITVPLDLPQSAIASRVEEVVRPLFALFGGHEVSSGLIKDIVEERLGV